MTVFFVGVILKGKITIDKVLVNQRPARCIGMGIQFFRFTRVAFDPFISKICRLCKMKHRYYYVH